MVAFARTKMNDASLGKLTTHKCCLRYRRGASENWAPTRKCGDQAKVFLFLARSEATGVYGDTCYGHLAGQPGRAHVDLLNLETVLEQGEKFDYLNQFP